MYTDLSNGKWIHTGPHEPLLPSFHVSSSKEGSLLFPLDSTRPLSPSSLLKERILLPEILANISLMEGHNGRRLELSSLGSGSSRHPKSQWDFRHGIHDDPLVLRGVLGNTAEMSLEDMVAIQVGHLTIWLDPHLVLRVRANGVESRNVQAELSRLCKLAKADSQGGEVIPSNTGCLLHNRLGHIVDTVPVKAEAVRFILSVNQVLDVPTNAIPAMPRKEGRRRGGGEEERAVR